MKRLANSSASIALSLFAVPLSIPPLSLTLSGTLPNDPSLCGVHVYLQGLEADGGASNGTSFSPGLDLAIGFP